MRKTALFLALAIIVSVSEAAPIAAFTKGSDEAGLQVVTEFLRGYFKAPGAPVTRQAILLKSESSLTVQSTIKNNVCTLRLKKDLAANSSGWTVEQNQCAVLFER